MNLIAVAVLLLAGGGVGAWACQKRLIAARETEQRPASTGKRVFAAVCMVVCVIAYLVGGR
jgi:hypothetical protein